MFVVSALTEIRMLSFLLHPLNTREQRLITPSLTPTELSSVQMLVTRWTQEKLKTQMHCQALVGCVAEIPIKGGSHNKTSDNTSTARKGRKPRLVGNKGNMLHCVQPHHNGKARAEVYG